MLHEIDCLAASVTVGVLLDVRRSVSLDVVPADGFHLARGETAVAVHGSCLELVVHLVVLGELGAGGGLNLGELHVRRLHGSQFSVLVLDLVVEILGGGEVLLVVGVESLELRLHVGKRRGFLASQLPALAAEALDLLAGGLAVLVELREDVVHLLADGLVLLARSEVRQAALGVEVVLVAYGGGGFGDLVDVLVQRHERLTVVVSDRLANLAHLGRVVERGPPVVVRDLVRFQGVEGRVLLVAVAGRRADVHRQVAVCLRLRGVGAAGARVSGTLERVADVRHGRGAHAERVGIGAIRGHGHRAVAVAKFVFPTDYPTTRWLQSGSRSICYISAVFQAGV